MVERFHRKSLTFPLAQLNKATEGIDLKFELYGEQVGARKLYSLLDTSHGSHTIIPRGTAREIFYALNALLHTLSRVPKPGVGEPDDGPGAYIPDGFYTPQSVGVVDADLGIVERRIYGD